MQPIYQLHNFVAPLSSSVRAAVKSRFSATRSYEVGEFIFLAGDVANYLYQIISGEIGLGNMSATGKELVFTKLKSGDCLGESGLIDGYPYAGNARAITAVKVRLMKKSDFLAVIEEQPEFARQILTCAYQRFRYLINLLSDANLLSLSERIIRTIQILSFSHPMVDKVGRAFIEVSHEELSTMVAASRQSVSKELKALENKGIIKIHYGKIYIVNQLVLAEMADRLSNYTSISATYDK